MIKVYEVEWNKGREQVWFLLFPVMWEGAINWKVPVKENEGFLSNVYLRSLLASRYFTVKICGFRKWSHSRKINLSLSNTKILPQPPEVPELENCWKLRKWAGERSQHYCLAIAGFFLQHLHLATLIPGYRAGLTFSWTWYICYHVPYSVICISNI